MGAPFPTGGVHERRAFEFQNPGADDPSDPDWGPEDETRDDAVYTRGLNDGFSLGLLVGAVTTAFGVGLAVAIATAIAHWWVAR